MTKVDPLRQLQEWLAKVEKRHKEEMRKLKTQHDQLEARLCAWDNSIHTNHKNTQVESQSRHTHPTIDNRPSRTHVDWRKKHHLFVDAIMQVELPLGWKSLTLERYDGTTDPDEHLDDFLT